MPTAPSPTGNSTSNSDRTLTRRTLMAGTAAVGATGAAIGAPDLAQATTPSLSSPNTLHRDPFTLGVASGEPTADGVVLWTRLAREPLADDGRGGMPPFPLPVSWQLCSDERMAKVERDDVAWATPHNAHSVHVELSGLEPDRHYWYRFRIGRYVSAVGRTRTAPRRGALPNELRMCFVSCAEFEHGYFHVYRSLVDEEPDLIVHLGDYIYEMPANTYVAGSGNIRDHVGGYCVSLGDYRQRYAQYKTDEDLQAAHQTAPFVVTFDDHEVSNDFRDMTPEDDWEQEGFRRRRAAAFQAYYENMPLRRSSHPHGAHIQVFRRLHWGRLATFHVLDTRQYADTNACGGGYHTGCPEVDDPNRSMLGERQEGWLLDGFRRSRARWDVLAQQTHFARRDADPEPRVYVNTDTWDGYAPTRDRITRGWAKVRNPLVISGDVHAHWASDLKMDYDDPDSRAIGSEFVTSSVTSKGDGWDLIPEDHPYLEINKHLQFYTNLRGYVRTRFTPERLDTDFRCVPHVSKPDAPPFTRRSFAVDDRVPGMRMTYDQPPINTPRFTDAEAIRRVIEWETADD